MGRLRQTKQIITMVEKELMKIAGVNNGNLIIKVKELVKDKVSKVIISSTGIRFEFEDGCFKEVGDVMYNQKKQDMKDGKKTFNMIEEDEVQWEEKDLEE